VFQSSPGLSTGRNCVDDNPLLRRDSGAVRADYTIEMRRLGSRQLGW